MKSARNIQITGAEGKPVLLDIYCDEKQEKQTPLLVFAHGFKGFKDWGPWDQMGAEFARSGFCFIKFNFSHNGTSPDNPLEFGDLEAFGQNNFSRELEDLSSVIDWATSGEQISNYLIDPAQIYLVGHSRGGATVIFQAATDPRVIKIATWAGVDSLENYLQSDMVEEWKKAGVHYIANARTGQQMPLYFQLYEDIVNHKDEFDIAHQLRNLSLPYLVVHGTEDPAVPYAAALQNYEHSQNSELETIIGANHVFGGRHPWDEEKLPDHLAYVVKRTTIFFQHSMF